VVEPFAESAAEPVVEPVVEPGKRAPKKIKNEDEINLEPGVTYKFEQ